MPAEWEPHWCTWLAWPHNPETWPDNLLAAQIEFLKLVGTIGNDERVFVVVPNQQIPHFNQMKAEILGSQKVEVVESATNDAWIRDFGPTFVTRQNQWLAIDWKYNAWGGKYPPFADDQAFVSRTFDDPVFDLPIESTLKILHSELCFEGGAIEVNGQGLALSTRSCVLDPNRNPDWTIDQIEQELMDCLGIEQCIWLTGDALQGDDTDGHIDQLARFVSPNRLVYAWVDDPADEQYPAIAGNLDDLRSFCDSHGAIETLTPLPLPKGIVYQGRPLPASYCNFYLTNRSVLVPQFGDMKADEKALEILDACFADKTVLGLPSYNLCCGLGSFHCLTQQQPALY